MTVLKPHKIIDKMGFLVEAGGMLYGARHGYWLEYTREGTVASITKYDRGIKHGCHFCFYGSGSLYLKAEYVDGYLEGPFTEYYTNGTVFAKGTYRKGTFDGWYPMYSEEGELLTLFHYSEDADSLEFDFFDKLN